MSKTPSSQRWLEERASDPYVQKAASLGFRSRSAFKLLEIDAKDRLLAHGQTVLDLGAAPGGWSQVAAQKVGSQGRVVATDILVMDPIRQVDFVQGDFTQPEVYEAVLNALRPAHADLVMSDMAPNMSGVKAIDQPRSIFLAELARECAATVIKPGGTFLVKLFMGEGFDAYAKALREHYAKVAVRKPKASRGRSSEVYVLARGYGI